MYPSTLGGVFFEHFLSDFFDYSSQYVNFNNPEFVQLVNRLDRMLLSHDEYNAMLLRIPDLNNHMFSNEMGIRFVQV